MLDELALGLPSSGGHAATRDTLKRHAAVAGMARATSPPTYYSNFGDPAVISRLLELAAVADGRAVGCAKVHCVGAGFRPARHV